MKNLEFSKIRKGNLIQYTSTDDIEEINYDPLAYLDDINGVKITDERLKEYGFIESRPGIFHLTGLELLQYNTVSVIKENSENLRFKYIHELQNYFLIKKGIRLNLDNKELC